MKILVLNSGSSSVKYQFLDMEREERLAAGKVERIGMDDALHEHTAGGQTTHEVAEILDHATAIRRVLTALTHPGDGVIRLSSEIDGVGHRVVHGGEQLTESVLITPEVKQMLREVIDLAPLHNPPNLMGILAAEAELGGVPQAAVFDTAFHATMPRTSFLYAIPYAMYRKYKIRRYGFHGTSHQYVAERLAARTGRPLAGQKVISCHLGNGCSVCAILHGSSLDTSMGFTPLEGLVMGTRSGDVDPGILPYIMAREELTLAELSSMLNKHSGLRGISGIVGDFRQIEAEMAAGDARATEAFEIFAYRLRKYIGAYAAAMDGVDAIIFTGGIGENSVRLRAAVCSKLTYLGVTLDRLANEGRGERTISEAGARVAVWVIPTNEELVIARDTRDLVLRARRQG
jgi:acetate kinase